MPPAAPRAERASTIGHLVAALLAGGTDVPTVDPQTDARVRAVVERLVAARAEVEAGDER